VRAAILVVISVTFMVAVIAAKTAAIVAVAQFDDDMVAIFIASVARAIGGHNATREAQRGNEARGRGKKMGGSHDARS
jgi:hypothetical protein